jgi:hypothetical protein
MIKSLILAMMMLFSLSSFAGTVIGPQTLLLSCTSSNSNQYQFIEVYGTLSDDFLTVTNVAVITSLVSHVGNLKMLIPGGTGAVDSSSKVTYSDLIESGSSLVVDGKTSLFTTKLQQITFSDCR